MILRKDIYKAIIDLMKSKYPSYKTYGHEVTEGYKKPSFFVDLVPRNISNESVNYKKYEYTIRITYFQKDADEIDNLTKIDEIQSIFGYKLRVEDQLFNITDFDYDFIGEHTNILQLSIDFEYIEYIEKEQGTIASELNINLEKR